MMMLEMVCLSIMRKVEWTFGILHALIVFSFLELAWGCLVGQLADTWSSVLPKRFLVDSLIEENYQLVIFC